MVHDSVNSVPMWTIRTTDEDIDVWHMYGNHENMFSLKIHYAGMFTPQPGRAYVNGTFSYVDVCDIDEFSVHELNDLVKKLGFSGNLKLFYHFRKPDSDLDTGMHALGNDHDVRKLAEYIRLGNKMIEVYIEHEKTTLHTNYMTHEDADLSTPKCVIQEIEAMPEMPLSKLKTRQPVKGNSAKKLMLDGNDGQASQGTKEIGESNQPVSQNMTQPSVFDDSFYSASDPFLGENDFDPFLDLDSLDVANSEIPPVVEEDETDRGEGHETETNEVTDVEEGSDSESSDGNDSEASDRNDSDELVDDENPLEHVHVDMDTFDKSNVDTMGQDDRQPEFNANEQIDVDIIVMDNEEFDSADEKDGLDRVRQMKLKQIKKQNKSKNSGVHKYYFYVGQQFGSREEVKDKVHIHSIETRRELFLKKNDKQRVRAECRGTIPVFEPTGVIGLSQGSGPSQVTGPSNATESSPKDKWTKGKISATKGLEYSPNSGSKSVGGKPRLRKITDNQCHWALYVSKVGDTETWQVKSYDSEHKCLQSRKIQYCSANFLSEGLMDQIESNPQIPIKAIQDQLQKKYKVEISRMKAYRAKSKAVDHVRGDFTSQYHLLRNYVMELKACNPNTTVRIGVESEEDHNCPTRIFKRIYVCLGAAKAGFKACLRDFLGFDGAFLNGPFPGQLLTAVGVDPNNGIYPLAYGIVESESKDSWSWFLEHLKEDLELQDNSNFTFINDRQKGIIPAIQALFPAAEHRFCLRHIHENMKLRWVRTAYKDLLCKAAIALTIPEFQRAMDSLKDFNKDCYDWLAKIPPQHWARSHFSGRPKTDMLLNNMCDVLNGQLVDGRDRPIISTLEYVREYMMKRIVICKGIIEKSVGPLM